MTPICITGSAPFLPAIYGALQPMGLQPAKPLERDPKTTLRSWHQRVVDAGQPQPSRVWQQLAADLFLANIDSPQWAWAEENALPLLDFWAGFDPAVRFVLLAETPAQALLRQRHQGSTPQLLTQWATKHQTLLRFALRQPERCLLVWGQHAQQDPQTLAQKMAQRWALSLAAKPQAPTDSPDPCPLAEHLAAHICQQQPAVQQLLSDLQACVEPLGRNTSHVWSGDPAQLLARYHTLSDRSAEAEQLAHTQAQLKAAQEQLKAAATKASADLKAAQDQLKAAQAAQTTAAAQAAQLQKDLQAQQTKAADADKALAAAKASAQAELSKTQAALKAAQEQSTKASADLKTAQDQLKAAQTKAADADKARATAQAELDKTRPLLKEAQDEAELLLNQLHVVQEELENYYYRNKELQAQAQAYTALQQRWNQLFAANPHLYASDHIDIAPAGDGSVRCTISGLHIGGRHFAQLQVGLALDTDGTLALQLPRAADGSGPLLRWPADVPAGASLSLNPNVGPDTPPQRIARYMQLSSADWQLASTLPRLLHTAVQAGPGTLDAPQQAALAQALQQHDQALAPFKRMLRFDQASLAAPASAEQLQLSLQHASHDGISTASLDLHLHTTPSGVHLQLGPNALLGNVLPLQLHLDTQGWRQPELATLSDTQRLRTNALLAVLPLALMDAVAHGASKDSLSPWGKLAPQLRAWSQLSHTPAPEPTAPAPAAAKKAPAKTAAKTTKTGKTPKDTKTTKTTKQSTAAQASAKVADKPRTNPRRKAVA